MDGATLTESSRFRTQTARNPGIDTARRV